MKIGSSFEVLEQSHENSFGVLMKLYLEQNKISLGATAPACDVQYLRKSI